MKIYLNRKFLANFLIHGYDGEFYSQIHRLLFSAKSPAEVVIVDIDETELHNNKELETLIVQFHSKTPSFKTSILPESQQPEFHENSEAKIFFIDDEHIPQLEDFGCLITNSSELEKAQFLFEAEDIRIDSTHKDWSVLAKMKHPCNALVITDNYLLSKDKKIENLSVILKSLMPKKLSHGFQFHLTIIGNDSGNHRPVDEEYKRIKNFLSSYNYSVNLTIIRGKKDYHDRSIFTNYFKITSGKGFGLFKKERNFNDNDQTTLDCKPITNFGSHSSTESTMKKELARCREINNDFWGADKIAGNRINRLLS